MVVSYHFVLAWGCPNAATQACPASTAKGQFYGPGGIAIDSSGNVYVSDGNNRIQKFDGSGNFILAWGSQGSGPGQFFAPIGVAVDSSGKVYVVDSFNNRVQKFDGTGNDVPLAVWGSLGSGAGQFFSAQGIVVDSSGNVYVTDSANYRVQKFDSNGNFLLAFGCPNAANQACVPGSGNGQFDSPMGVAVDSSGNVFVADYANNRIQKFDGSGHFILTWGSQGSGLGQFLLPAGVAVDSSGNVYVTDRDNARVQKFDGTGNPLPSAFWGAYGHGTGQFNSPIGVALDSSGNVYVTDTGNNRVQKFAPHEKGKDKDKEAFKDAKEAKDEIGLDHSKFQTDKYYGDHAKGGFKDIPDYGASPLLQSEMWLASSETIRRLSERVEYLERKVASGKSFIKPEERPRVGRRTVGKKS